MPTFSNDDNGNKPLYYLPVTLSANDGNGFQQKIDFDASTYSTYLSSTVSNINFQDGNGNLLYSWQETHAPTTSSTDVIYWILLPNSTITTVYIVFVATTESSISGTHTGAEPTYSSTYAQYDNGTSVFTDVYWNYNGTSLPTGTSTLASSDASISSNNGLSATSGITDSPSFAYIVYTTALSANSIVESYVTSATAVNFGGVNYDLAGVSSSSTVGAASTTGNNNFSTYIGASYYNVGGGTQLCLFNNSSNDFQEESYSFPSKFVFSSSYNEINAYVNYTSYTSTDTYTSSVYMLVGIASAGGSAGSPEAGSFGIQWSRSRIYPTNGTMPTLTYGSVTKVSTSPPMYSISFKLTM